MSAATATLREAAQKMWDVVVVGAGPAGALAARAVARRGCSVLLVDKAVFPRWKVCGSCLNGRALGVLADVGLGQLTVQHRAIPLDAFHVAAVGDAATVSLPGGVALSRRAFDAALVEAAIAAGCTFLPGTRAAHETLMADTRTLRLTQAADGATVTARVVLAADGLAGTLAPGRAHVAPHSRVGAGVLADAAPSFYRSGVIYMACGRDGYVGLVRQEDDRVDIAAAFEAAVLPGVGPGPLATRILAAVGWPAIPALADLPWRGTPALTRSAALLAEERLFVVGDAAGYVEPFTGEGMAWALAGAVAVAPFAVAAADHWRDELPLAWADCYRRTVRSRQTVCRAAAGLLRRPTLTRLLVGILRRAPWLAGPVVRTLNHHPKAHRGTPP